MKELSKQDLLHLYRSLIRTRKFDQLNVRLAAEGKLLTFYHSAHGHEAVGVGASSLARDDDYLFIHHRGHGLPYSIPRGIDPKSCVAEHMGRATGWGGGITGFHAVDKEKGVLSSAGTIGSGFVLSAGYGLAAKKNGRGQIAFCFSGDGGVQRGQFHEAMNLCAAWKLPVVFVVENNGMAWFTPNCDTTAVEHVADLAKAYQVPGEIVDGMDVLAVYRATEKAVERARKGEGPSLIECKTFRYRPHSEGRPDVSHYEPRSKEEIASWMERDPVRLFEEKLLKKKVLTAALIEEIAREADEESAAAEKFSFDSPFPDPARLPDMVYAP
ncbi:thiamine pyrophosphate-dependent dehydrogenase E1 component subunit alpha [Geomonas azotofigens]|uniref:thiamine pyrophosphate-dependent dehydrogenase E1 component subunit alpha n=1 Tax=Geomonas azotofigens TaxID=2843196 RepID=UPI001C0F94CD|nr:thiamine pyrophosphate-dependent dehydrogenase E1 component subunit alpha [Geomonas azotofigens]MBU5613814.1 thiamine pyrophosphate-dependent dehydrogenase E1 component subunit alpha [Geomonas azotofigens]